MAASSGLDILALGNAIVDVLAQTDERFLVDHELRKGTMALIDESRAEALSAAMGPARIVSGGSAANTAVGAALLGAKAGFVGKVHNDALGKLFTNELNATGVSFTTKPAMFGAATARSFILVTPDGERTMNTYLGACQDLNPDDIDDQQVASAKIVYLEGYLWDPPAAKEAFRKAVSIAHREGNRVALSLSDPFCVDRYRSEFRELLSNGSLDILFANIHELQSLYETSDPGTAFETLKQEKVLGVVTRSEEGATVVTEGRSTTVPAFPAEEVVDTTGAGDLFAAGFLAGLSYRLPHEACAKLGALAAAEVIGHMGARPVADLAALARREGLLR